MINLLITPFLLSSIVWGISAVPRPDLRSRKGKFSIPAIRSDLLIDDSIKNPQSLNKVWDHNNSSMTTRRDGSVGANLLFPRRLFSSPITVGGQNLNVLIDSGSADIWVCSTLQPSEQLRGHSYYDSTKSITFVNLNKPFSITYSDSGTATGDTGTDTITIGETTVSGQAFGLAADVIDSQNLDGLVGLGFSTMTTIGKSTFLENALPSLTNGLFTAYLPRNGIGEYNFGEIDNTKYRSTITYAPISTLNGVWLIKSNAFKFGNIPWQDEGLFGIMDTGSSSLHLEKLLVFQYYESGVQGWDFNTRFGVYVFPCEATLPDFSFKIGDETYVTIPGSDLNAGILPDDPPVCFGAIQASPSIEYNVYGLPFFKNYFAIFDQSNRRFGFAPIK